MKEAVYRHLFLSLDGNRLAKAVDWGVLTLIVANIAAVVLETAGVLSIHHGGALHVFERVSVVVFAGEYVLHLWACTCDRRYGGTVRGRLRYALSFFALVDLAAIVPFFVPVVATVSLSHVRVLGLFRLLRILKVGRYSDAILRSGLVQ